MLPGGFAQAAVKATIAKTAHFEIFFFMSINLSLTYINVLGAK
jgi:hypothetical protein